MIADGIAWVHNLTRDLGIPSLSTYGVTDRDIPAIVEKSLVASSTKANPIALTADEMAKAVRMAM
jgi:alcohol dehydrogenase class IV